MTLEENIKNLREAWYAGDHNGAERYLDFIMDGGWTSREFLEELIIPSVKWREHEEKMERNYDQTT